tara:strand:+ start:25620 stop:26189 length:570 start_codon:yes stop_codon:yes gene_type:complete
MKTFIFEISVILISVLLLLVLVKMEKKTLKRYLILVVGFLIFEFFTQPLWHNKNMSNWAYLYQDVSWVLTIGWASILLFSMFITDYYFKLRETKRFFIYLLIAGIIGIIAEAIVISLGIRSYSPDVMVVLSNINIVFTQVPIETLYYMPVFMALIIGFTRYFEMCFNKTTKIKSKKTHKKTKRGNKRKK